ncbi:uncharacterized protein LOC103938910 [Pyrus x bretschneideri]|uniref:uncharacterized protein LOC103938910 n=1 Tax=Pyrus x bretschneideri TaxID=225117 RepID=UPI00051171F0|nr:uncharacterized protein LOC103938910 [Pyrus x bretschneideri]
MRSNRRLLYLTLRVNSSSFAKDKTGDKVFYSIWDGEIVSQNKSQRQTHNSLMRCCKIAEKGCFLNNQQYWRKPFSVAVHYGYGITKVYNCD